MQNIKNLENKLRQLEKDVGLLNTQLENEQKKGKEIGRRLEIHNKNLKKLQIEEQSLKREVTKETLNQRRSKDKVWSFKRQLQQLERTAIQTEKNLKSKTR